MPNFFLIPCTLLFGLCFGSFANVLIYRLPRKESIVSPPSHCPACNQMLKAFDMIPVLSWLFLKGKCRHCGEKISFRYPLVEAACAVLFYGMVTYTGANFSAVPLCMLAFMLFTVSVIDAYTQEIPDGLLIFGAVVGGLWLGAAVVLPTLFAPFAPLWYDALLGVLTGALPLFLIDRLVILTLKKDGFGFGDVKLMAVAGLFLGWKLILVSFFFAFIAGGLFGAFLLLTKRAQRGSYLAFGPFLSAGVLSALWFGDTFIRLLLGI